MPRTTDDLTTRTVEANGLTVQVATAGSGPAVVLLHGFPHTWQVWAKVIPTLARTHTVIAPDLRGLGGTTRAQDGYDALTLAADTAALLDALDVPVADVVGLDLGVAPAFLLALTRPDRVRRLVLMEALVGRLPGAEAFLGGGPPWWFGFHTAPGLAERVLAGHEGDYVDFFLEQGTRTPLDREFRDAVVDAYSRPDSLRCAFAHYRGFTESADQISSATQRHRLTVPTMTVGAVPVGDTTFRQLRPLADDLVGHVLADCGHILPQDRPAELLELLHPFLAQPPARRPEERSTA